jgi:transcriptional regulator with XRE-family HTH domain
MLLFQVMPEPPRSPRLVERRGVNSRAEVRDFLTTRRARITPERAGLPAYGGHRRVAGLRREEVALLAGVSVDYYTRLERGNLSGVSDSVLEALARALQLDEAERAHLFDLARAANTSAATARGRRRPAAQLRPGAQLRPAAQLRPGVQRLLDAMTMAPAYVRNGRLDVLGANPLGRAVFAPLFDTAAPTPTRQPARGPAAARRRPERALRRWRHNRPAAAGPPTAGHAMPAVHRARCTTAHPASRDPPDRTLTTTSRPSARRSPFTTDR